MARDARDLHTRLVGWAKIILPVLALTLLSSLFLISNRIGPEDAIKYTDAGFIERLDQDRITGATFSGVTASGGTFALRTTEVLPGTATQPGQAPDSGRVNGVSGTLTAKGGAKTDLVADAAQITDSGQQATLTGNVMVKTTTGYQITTDLLQTDQKRGTLTSPGPVRALGPNGTLTADRMTFGPKQDGTPGDELLFNGRVKLLYGPKK